MASSPRPTTGRQPADQMHFQGRHFNEQSRCELEFKVDRVQKITTYLWFNDKAEEAAANG
jgi:hypothetical protein